MAETSDSEGPIAHEVLHPAVLRVLAALQASSPAMRVSDPVQSSSGCFKQLRKERCRPSSPHGHTKSQILQLKALNNPDLVPAASNQMCVLSDLSSSALYRRRARSEVVEH